MLGCQGLSNNNEGCVWIVFEVFLVLPCLLLFLSTGSKNTIIIFEKEWYCNGERDAMDQSEGVSPWQSQSPHLNSFNCCIADKKKNFLCQKPLTHRDRVMPHTIILMLCFSAITPFNYGWNWKDSIHQTSKWWSLDITAHHTTHIRLHWLQYCMLETMVVFLRSYWKTQCFCVAEVGIWCKYGKFVQLVLFFYSPIRNCRKCKSVNVFTALHLYWLTSLLMSHCL